MLLNAILMLHEQIQKTPLGVNRVADATKKSGYRLTGDVHFPSVSPLCSKITPVPGGVGPMTVALLMKNTVKARRQNSLGARS